MVMTQCYIFMGCDVPLLIILFMFIMFNNNCAQVTKDNKYLATLLMTKIPCKNGTGECMLRAKCYPPVKGTKIIVDFEVEER